MSRTEDGRIGVADPATQAPPEAAEASSPSGECPLREDKPKHFTDVRSDWLKRGSGGQVFAIMCESGGLPTVLHKSFNAAAYQAAKLAHQNPGKRFHVLASQKVSFAEVAPVEAEQVAA